MKVNSQYPVKKSHMIAILFLAIKFIVTGVTTAQDIGSFTLSGYVYDKQTNEPLNNVNVFLSSTTLGSATNKAGKFQIHNIPTGSYTLMISIIGYKVKNIDIIVNTDTEKDFTVGMVKQPIKAPLIVITGKRDREFLRLVKKIRPFLLGISSNAGKCTIENPEVLKINSSENDKQINFSTNDIPLVVKNMALGYQIDIYIDSFAIYNSQKVSYFMRPRFIPLHPRNQREAYRWERNRRRAYEGSLPHLFGALINDRLEEEGFRIYELKNPPSSITLFTKNEIKATQLVRTSNTLGEFNLDLPGWLMVVYRGEPEVKEFYDYMKESFRDTRAPSVQTSFLESLTNQIKVSADGHFFNKTSIVCHGHLAFERLAELLPMDYKPPRSKEPKKILLSPSQLIKQAISLAEENKDLHTMTKMYYEGLEKLGNNAFADTLFHGIKDILSTKEIKGYKDTDNKGEFLLKIFQILDPSPATPENERISVHYQRLKYARTWFSSPQSRGYDDRGEIWVRYGEPDLRERFPSPGLLYPNECWVYWISNGIWFDFINNAGHYELLKQYKDEIVGPTKTEKFSPMALFIKERRHLHIKFSSLSTGKVSKNGVNELEFETFFRQASIPRSIDKLIHSCDIMDLIISSARFYRGGQTRLELYYGIPGSDLHMQSELDSIGIPLRVVWTLRDNNNAIIGNEDRFIDVTKFPDNGDFINQAVVMSSGFSYNLALELQLPLRPAVAEKVITFEGFSAAEKDVFLSDIQFSEHIEPISDEVPNTQFVKHNLLIKPYPFDEVDHTRPIYLYFEIYNMLITENGFTDAEISYEVRYKKQGLERINPFINTSSYSIGTSFKVHVPNQEEPVYFALDLSEMKPHLYTIIVIVKDNVSDRSYRRERVVTVR